MSDQVTLSSLEQFTPGNEIAVAALTAEHDRIKADYQRLLYECEQENERLRRDLAATRTELRERIEQEPKRYAAMTAQFRSLAESGVALTEDRGRLIVERNRLRAALEHAYEEADDFLEDLQLDGHWYPKAVQLVEYLRQVSERSVTRPKETEARKPSSTQAVLDKVVGTNLGMFITSAAHHIEHGGNSASAETVLTDGTKVELSMRRTTG